MTETPDEKVRLLEYGMQPLDEILTRFALKNSDLVKNSKAQLTHKMVAKGRKGRYLSRNVQAKIVSALNASQAEKKFVLPELFNY